jgi:hypothetical protein
MHGCSRRSEHELNPVQDEVEGKSTSILEFSCKYYQAILATIHLLDQCSVMVQIKKKGKPTCCPFLRYSRTRILPAVTPTASVSPISSTTVTPLHRLGFIDHQATPIQLGAVKGLDRPLGLSPGTHLHEAETP